ncbi:uncharacterized protein LOC108858376 [Raphanus sativus]|uniref:Uncharacterized protein LOC108858376 n=1 Tax=Raphanus sativus TaxID=3726 RepID=A0A9W3C1Y6_RAPSA|nr:uncharacterized protein LOC108858376 [Raphanus sativus]
MASNDDLEFPFEANPLLFLDSPETFNAATECQESPSLLASQNEHSAIVPFVPVSAATNDVYPPSLIENPDTDQEDDYSRSINALQLSPNVQSYTLGNGQRESVFSENCLLTSTNNAMMSTGQQSVGLQHGYVNQSYQQPLMSQTNHNLFNDPYVSPTMGSNLQQVERTNGLTNFNPIYGLRDHRLPHFGYSIQEGRHNLDLLVEQLKHIRGNDQMQQPETSNRHIPPYVEALQSNQHLQIPYALSASTIPNPEYRTPMISNTQVLQTTENCSPFAQTSYQSDPFAFNFQNLSSVKTTRRARGRPRKNQIPVPLVPTSQTLLTSPRHYGTQDKGKQPITARPPLNPSLYAQCQNSYTNTMIQQSGVTRQRSIYDQFENECSTFKTRRIMVPCQEKSIADSSTASFWQEGNLRSSSAAASNHEERPIKNTMYDPLYADVGLPIDPHLRLF